MGGGNGHKSQTADRGLGILQHFLDLLCYSFSKAESFSSSFLLPFFFFSQRRFQTKERLKNRDQAYGQVGQDQSGFWKLAYISSRRTGLRIVHDKFCQKFAVSFTHFRSCAQQMKRHIKACYTKMHFTEISPGRKKKLVFLSYILKNINSWLFL